MTLGQDKGKENVNALWMHELLKQNETLMGMLELKKKPSEKVYIPPNLSQILPNKFDITFDRKCKPREAANWVSTLCGEEKLHR